MVGFASGTIHALRSNLALVKGAALIGVDFRQAGERDGPLALDLQREAVAMYHEGRVRPLISHVLPLAHFDSAIALVGDRAGFGRVVFRFDAAA